MANLLSWAANALGSGIDKVIPGDQSFLHPTAPKPQAPISDASRMTAANIGRAVGYGNSNSTQPYSPPMLRPTPQSLNLPAMKVQAQLPPQSPSFGQKALGVAGNVGNMLLGDVNHLAKVISYPINTAQYQDMARKGQITQEQASQLINQAGDEAGFNIQDKGGTVLRKSAGAVAMPTATILTAGAAPAGAAALKGLPLGVRALKAAKAVAPIGAGFGAIQTLGQKDPITAKDAAINIGAGAVGGALLGGAAPIAGVAAKAGVKGTIAVGKATMDGAEALAKAASKAGVKMHLGNEGGFINLGANIGPEKTIAANLAARSANSATEFAAQAKNLGIEHPDFNPQDFYKNVQHEVSIEKQIKAANPKLNVPIEDSPTTKLITLENIKQQQSKAFQDQGEKMFGSRKDMAKFSAIDSNALGQLEAQGPRVAENMVTKSRVLGQDAKYAPNLKGDPGLENLKQTVLSSIPGKPAANPLARQAYVNEMPQLVQAIKNAPDATAVRQVMKDFAGDRNASFTNYYQRSRDIKNAYGSRFMNVINGNSTAVREAIHRPPTDFTWAEKKAVEPRTAPVSGETIHGGELLPYDRKGAPDIGKMSPEQVKNTFNIKGLEYGNYVKDSEAQVHIQRYADSLHDMERATGLNVADLMDQMKLGTAFGARGSSKALAHYEPSTKVINLTKKNGADGSLGHEFGHALDDWLGSGKMGRDEYASSGKAADPKINEAMKQVMHTIKDGNAKVEITAQPDGAKGFRYPAVDQLLQTHNGDAQAAIDALMQRYPGTKGTVLQKVAQYAMAKSGAGSVSVPTTRSAFMAAAEGKGDYWKRDTELFARSFADYLRLKQDGLGSTNNYLTHGTKGGPLFSPDNPQELVPAFDNLMKTIKDVKGIGAAPDRGIKPQVKAENASVAQSTPKINENLNTNDAAKQFGKDAGIVNTKPSHQEAIEAAMNKGDLPTVGKLIRAIPDGDPYKQSMVDLFKDRIPVLKELAKPTIPDNVNTNMAAKVYAKQNGLAAPKPAPVVASAEAKNASALFKTLKNEGAKPLAKANGDAYEAATATNLRKQGYTVEETGKTLGREDGGIDNIAHKDGKTILIQNKYRSRDTTIHFGTVAQMLGAEAKYKGANKGAVSSALYTTVGVDKDAAALAKANGINLIQTDLAGKPVKLAIHDTPTLPPTKTDPGDNLQAMLNSVPMSQRAHLQAQLANPSSQLAKSIAEASPQNAHQLVRRFYQGFDPKGSFELNLSKALGANIAKARTSQAVLKSLEGDARIVKAVREKAQADPAFMKALTETKTKSGVRALINSSLDAPVYEPVGGGAGAPPTKLPSLPLTAPNPADKMRGLTKGIKKSDNFSPELQKKVDSKYTPFTDKEALASHSEFMKQGVNKAQKQAIATLSDKNSNIGKQEVVNFGKTIQELDAKGRTDEATAIHDLLAERLTRAGQTSQAAKLLYNRTPEGLRNMAFRDLRNAKVEITPEIKAEVEGHLKTIKSLPDGEAKNFAIAVMQKSIAKHLPQEKVGQAVSVWKAGLLSGVKTQGGNFESNATFGVLKKASDPIATGIDKLLSLKTGQRTKTTTMQGLTRGAMEGLKKGTVTMRTGIDMRNIDKYEQHAELNFGNKWMNRLIANPSNLVFRGMSAADQPFWYAGLKNSLYDQAKADGLNLGLKGDALQAHMNKLVQNPTEKMAETGLKEANKSTLAYDTLGFKAISGLHSGIDNSGFSKAGKDAAHAVINVLAPFTKVPTAFLSRTVDFTPLGPIKEVLSQISHKQFDQRQFSQALAEGVTGTGVVALGMSLARQGMLSGDYPKNDAKEQARWRTEHITANSVKIGGTWHSLNYMGPVGLLFNAGNQMVQAEKNNGAGAYEKAGAALAGLGQGLLGQSFLSGFSGFSDAIKDPEQNFNKWVYSQAGSVVPNIVNDGRNLVDNMQRQVNSAGDAIINKLPGFSQNLPAKVGAFGEDLPNNSTGFSSLSPDKPSDSVDSPLLSELNRLGTTGKENAVFPVADKNLGSGKDLVKLTPAQVTQRQKLVGAQIKPLWEQITTSPGYAKLDDGHKAQALKNALTDVNSAVTRTMQSQIAPALNSKPATGNTALILGGNTPSAESYVNKAAASGSGTSGQTPAQKYLTNLTNYKNAKAAGTLSGPKLYATEQSLAKEAITSKYSQDVLDFYAMSKTEAANYFNTNPTQAQALYDQAKQLDSQLGGTKYKYGLDPKPKKAKVAKLPKAITTPKISKLVSGLKVNYKAPKLPKMPSSKMAALPKLKASGIKVTKGKSVAVKPQQIAIPKVKGFKGYA